MTFAKTPFLQTTQELTGPRYTAAKEGAHRTPHNHGFLWHNYKVSVTEWITPEVLWAAGQA